MPSSALHRLQLSCSLSACLFFLLSTSFAFQAAEIADSQRINPEDLVKMLQTSSTEKAVMLQVGSHVLFAQAHIPNSEYMGAASTEDGLTHLRKRVTNLPHSKLILLYCGCCPWTHCPNVKPAVDALRALGFTNVKVLYIANNFGADWVSKGYPVANGE